MNYTKRRKNFLKERFSLGQRRCSFCCVQLNFALGFKNSATVDHSIPKCVGGTYRKENLLLVCFNCNQKKGKKTLEKFVEEIKPPRVEWLLTKKQQAEQAYRRA